MYFGFLLECSYLDVPITYKPPSLFTISFSLFTVTSNSVVAAANAARSNLRDVCVKKYAERWGKRVSVGVRETEIKRK